MRTLSVVVLGHAMGGRGTGPGGTMFALIVWDPDAPGAPRTERPCIGRDELAKVLAGAGLDDNQIAMANTAVQGQAVNIPVTDEQASALAS